LLVWPPSRRKSPSSAPRIQLAFQVRPFLLMKGLLFGEAARRSGRYRRDESPAAATGSSVEQRLRRIVLRIASTCAAHSSRACSRGVAHGPRWQAQLRQPRRPGEIVSPFENICQYLRTNRLSNQPSETCDACHRWRTPSLEQRSLRFEASGRGAFRRSFISPSST
jgi:hypothetical protein